MNADIVSSPDKHTVFILCISEINQIPNATVALPSTVPAGNCNVKCQSINKFPDQSKLYEEHLIYFPIRNHVQYYVWYELDNTVNSVTLPCH